MKTDLFFDFTVDKQAKTVFITREFDAPLSLCGMYLQKLNIWINGWLRHLILQNKIHEF
jgi:hypothetical protein